MSDQSEDNSTTNDEGTQSALESAANELIDADNVEVRDEVSTGDTVPDNISDQFRRLMSPVPDRLRTLPVDIGFRHENIHITPDDRVGLVNELMQRWWVEAGCWVTAYGDKIYVTSPRTPGYYTRLIGGEDELIGAVRLMLDGLLYARGEEVVEWHPRHADAADAARVIIGAAPTDPEFGPGSWMLDGEYEWTREWLRERYGDEVADELPIRADDDHAYIACHSGIIWLSARLNRMIVLPHTPGLFLTSGVDCEYDPEADDGWGGGGEPSRWLAFLGEVFEGDEGAPLTLQEWYGRVMAGVTRIHKFTHLVGRPRSGKGTIVRVLERVLGVRNRKSLTGSDRVASMTPQEFHESFALENALGKALIVFPDARFSKRDALTLQRCLSLVGEDTVRVNRKGKEALSVQLTAGLMMVSNTEADIQDDTGAFAERAIPIDFPHSFVGREDRRLYEQLETELTGILHWALQGALRIMQPNAEFSVGERSARLLEVMRDRTSVVRVFIREHCVIEPDAVCTKDALGQAWASWVEDADVDAKSSKKALRSMITDARLEGVDEAMLTPRQAAEAGLARRQARVWTGIRLRRSDELADDA